MRINQVAYNFHTETFSSSLFGEIQFFLRCMIAKTKIIFKVKFFEKKTLVWNFVLPLFWALQFYFQYIPFGNKFVSENIFGSNLSLTLINYTLTGQLVWILFLNASLFGGIFFLYERIEGTLETLFMTPSSRISIMMGSSLAGALNFIWFLIFSIILIPFLDVKFHVSSPFGIFLAILVIILSMITFGLFLQTMFIGTRLGSNLANAIQEPIIFTSGMVFPIRSLPKILMYIGLSLPLSYSLFLLRGLLFNNLSLNSVLRPLVILSILMMMLLIASITMIKLIEDKMKSNASLTLF